MFLRRLSTGGDADQWATVSYVTDRHLKPVLRRPTATTLADPREPRLECIRAWFGDEAKVPQSAAYGEDVEGGSVLHQFESYAHNH